MAKRKKSNVDFPFYVYLKLFHDQNRKKVYSSYKDLTKKFLNFNNPENKTSWLRKPQFEALEMYVFLKEFLDNKYLYEVFADWYQKTGRFEGRDDIGISTKKGTIGSGLLFGPSEFQGEDKEVFQEVFKQIEAFKQIYPNYIFALTMGLGKTILMATSIFYEFLLANKYPKTKRYCHNALVFAPDKTVLQSLKEIVTFDKSKVIPHEYVNWLDTHLKFHFLDSTGISLNVIDKSRYNIIISNTQKIILKKKHKETTAAQNLFNDNSKVYQAKSLNKDFDDLYDFDISNDKELLTNQRFEKLIRLKQLGIYVDEAHHVFGNNLAKDFGLKKSSTSLRVTINELAETLSQAGSRVVGCYNYTGTPYVGSRLLPEVVYAYGLKEAIDNEYLKRVKISGFENIKDQTLAFVKTVIKEFWKQQEGKRYEGMLPKIAFFASNINELQTELRPAVEEVLTDLNIPISKILVNVGDSKITTNDDIREFKRLDSPQSEKQFILLVNKGTEGWNCRSLFGVGLHRQPKSKVFVLQATMRCLRSIGEVQETGLVYLSAENISILEKELQENFKLSVDDLQNSGEEKERVEVRVVPPPVKIKLRRVRKLHNLKEKTPQPHVDLEFDQLDTDKYRIIRSERNIKDLSKKAGTEEDVTYIKEKRAFSALTLTAEIARYLNRSPIEIKRVLETSKEGLDRILTEVNAFNEILYDWIIPRLFNEFYDLMEFKSEEEEEVDLVKEPKDGDCYRLLAKPDLTVNMAKEPYVPFQSKSFHLDHYIFDSAPEYEMFKTLLGDDRIDKVWFTGMLTHGQSDFMVRYIDPESYTVRSYYPDFLVKLKDGKDEEGEYVIIEVKGDNKVDDEVVKAKAAYAKQLAGASGMRYEMIKGSDAVKGEGIYLK